MKAKINYSIVEGSSVAASSSAMDSMNVIPYMRSLFLVNSKNFSLKPNSRASANFKTIASFPKEYEVLDLKLSDMFVSLDGVSDDIASRIIQVMPIPDTIDVDSILNSLNLEERISYIVNLTGREISSTLDSVQKRMSREWMRDLYILDKKNFSFNEANVLNVLDEALVFDVTEEDFKNAYIFPRIFMRDIHEKFFNGLESNLKDGELYFNFIGASGLAINETFFANSVDNAYVNKSFITPKLLEKGFIGNSKFDRIDLTGKIFMLLIGMLFEDSDKQTSKNGVFVPHTLYTNCDNTMIEDLEETLSDKYSRLSVYCNSDEDDGGVTGVKISWTRSCNKNKKELEGVVAIETVMAIVILEKQFMKKVIRENKGIGPKNLITINVALGSFMENMRKLDKVSEAYVVEINSIVNPSYVLKIRNHFKVKTETKGLEVIIEKEI